MRDPLRLAELVAARVLHDVGGLAATLNATLELTAQEFPEAGENLPAAIDAAGELGRRVTLLRAAWGPTEGPLPVVRLPELAQGAAGGHRLRIDISALPARLRLSPALGRIMINVMLLAMDSLPRGGTLTLSPAQDHGLVAAISGPRAAWPDGFEGILADEDAAWAALRDPRQLLGPLLAIMARSLGVRVSLLTATRRGPPPLLLGPT